MCSVGGNTRQLIFLVIDCRGSDVVCERYLNLKTVGVSTYPLLDSDMGIRG